MPFGILETTRLIESYSDLQEDFYEKISKHYGAKRGESTSRIMNTNEKQKLRFCRFKDDEYDQYYKDYFDDPPCFKKRLTFLNGLL